MTPTTSYNQIFAVFFFTSCTTIQSEEEAYLSKIIYCQGFIKKEKQKCFWWNLRIRTRWTHELWYTCADVGYSFILSVATPCALAMCPRFCKVLGDQHQAQGLCGLWAHQGQMLEDNIQTSEQPDTFEYSWGKCREGTRIIWERSLFSDIHDTDQQELWALPPTQRWF